MTTRFRYRAPNGAHRDHWRRRADGTWREKVNYSEAEAPERAAELQANVGGQYHSYRCPICRAWHVGRVAPTRPRGPWRRLPNEFFDELGERVCAHLRIENAPHPGKRNRVARFWRRARMAS